MKTVGIDIRMIQNTGIGTYVRGLLSAFPSSRNIELRLFGNAVPIPGCPYPIFPFDSKIYTIQEQFRYLKLLKRCQLWHAPHYNIPFFKGKTKLVVTVHDLIHWIYRKDFFTPLQAFYAKTMFQRVASQADHIISVSQKTREDLIQHFKAKPEKISVVYEGVEKKYSSFASFEDLTATLESFRLPDRYFLYVGSLKPHKNILFLVEIFRALRKAGKIQSDLVLVGKKDSKYPPAYQKIQELTSGDGVHHISAIKDRELAHLYQGALALVHPSLYEGFGLTLLEAMACGTPVISSHAASLPEVAGDAAILFDPKSETALAQALQEVEKNESLRRALRERGLKQLQKFSWENTARQTFGIYEKVLSL